MFARSEITSEQIEAVGVAEYIEVKHYLYHSLRDSYHIILQHLFQIGYIPVDDGGESRESLFPTFFYEWVPVDTQMIESPELDTGTLKGKGLTNCLSVN